jgi:hypothetical protein
MRKEMASNFLEPCNMHNDAMLHPSKPRFCKFRRWGVGGAKMKIHIEFSNGNRF